MYSLLVIPTMSLLTVAILFSISWPFSGVEKKSSSDSPFECGFDSREKNRPPLTLSFFLVGVLFVVFDVELVICLPLFGIWTLQSWLVSWFIITQILGVGYLLEVVLGSLEWKD